MVYTKPTLWSGVQSPQQGPGREPCGEHLSRVVPEVEHLYKRGQLRGRTSYGEPYLITGLVAHETTKIFT